MLNDAAFNEVAELSSEKTALAKIINVIIPSWESGTVFRTLCLADIHIGCLRGPLGLEVTLSRHKAAFDEFLQEVARYKPHAIFIPGDIFHFKTISEKERDIWNWFIVECLRHCVVVMHPGNHDYIIRGLSHLDYLQKFADQGLIQNLYIASNVSQIIRFQSKDKVDSFVVLNSPCEVRIDLTEIKIANVVLFHGDVRGAVFDNGYDPTSDESYVDKRITLPYKEADLFILGDIHKAQDLSDNAFYCASMVQTKWGEDKEKGYCRAEFWLEGGSFKWTFVRHVIHSPSELLNITVKDDAHWPEEWPEGCWIKLKHASNVTFPIKMPSNIVKYEIIGSARYVNDAEDDSQDKIVSDFNQLDILSDPYEDAERLLTQQTEVEITVDDIPLIMKMVSEMRSNVC